MKKAITWILISALVLIAFPWIETTFLRRVYVLREIRFLVINPILFLVLGISIGKSMKKHWFLLIIALVFAYIAEVFIVHVKWGLNYETLFVDYGVYTAIAVIAMVSSHYINNDAEGKLNFKSIIIKSIISSVVINGACFLTNLIYYYTNKDLVFGSTSWGGDYSGKTGFGLLLNQLYPQTKLGDPQPSRTMWLSFAPFSLIKTILLFFIAAFVVFLIYEIIKTQLRKNKQDVAK